MSPAPALAPPRAAYNVSLGYLRAFVTVLVLLHHALLAYVSFAPLPPRSLLAQPRWWQAFPVVDAARWDLLDLIAGWNDSFFMSLMFFLSGLFVWQGLARKGAASFLRDRARRLGIPFLFAAAILSPLAYYPAYLQTGAAEDPAGYWSQWMALRQWPVGPVWFLSLLLVFGATAAGLYAVAPYWGERLGRVIAGLSARPAAFFLILAAVTFVVYLPPALVFGTMHWTTFGPFVFQTSRVFHYAAYFFVAIALGACGFDRGLLAPDGLLARHWPRSVIASLALFFFSIVLLVTQPLSILGGSAAFVLTCGASTLAILAVFLRFVHKHSRALDSLRDNSYGMYLVHYPIVTWLQYALLPASMPAAAKAATVFTGAVGLSWVSTAALRRLRPVAGII